MPVFQYSTAAVQRQYCMSGITSYYKWYTYDNTCRRVDHTTNHQSEVEVERGVLDICTNHQHTQTFDRMMHIWSYPHMAPCEQYLPIQNSLHQLIHLHHHLLLNNLIKQNQFLRQSMWCHNFTFIEENSNTQLFVIQAVTIIVNTIWLAKFWGVIWHGVDTNVTFTFLLWTMRQHFMTTNVYCTIWHDWAWLCMIRYNQIWSSMIKMILESMYNHIMFMYN